MGYLGTKPANSPLTSELIPDGMIGTSDLANGAVTQDKLSTYIAPKGTPAFSAYQSSAQTLSSGTLTKIQFQTEEFDTANAFDSTTNYRFTPQVAGYYQITAAISISTTNTPTVLYLYKNGAINKYICQSGTAALGSGFGTALVYLNGSTDYIELYAIITTGQALIAQSSLTYFQAVMARAA
jgi:hypothetical protein